MNLKNLGVSLLLLLLAACSAPTPEEAYRDNLSEVWKVNPYLQKVNLVEEQLASQKSEILREAGKEELDQEAYDALLQEFVEEEMAEVIAEYCEPLFRETVTAQELADFAQVLRDTLQVNRYELVYNHVCDFENELDTFSLRKNDKEEVSLEFSKVVMLPLSVAFKERCDTLYMLCGNKMAQDIYNRSKRIIRSASDDSAAVVYLQDNLPMLFLNAMNNRLSENQMAEAMPVSKILVKLPTASVEELYEKACRPAFCAWLREK